MQIPGRNIEALSQGSLNESLAQISDLPLILDILRNKLYKDPILATCREIIVNARDAHREIGTPNRPIEITIPNIIYPNLVIKDYGPGLSPERIKIFGNYGGSTKRADNVQHGGYGLGSKAPYSYTDIFNVSTNVDGIKYLYTCYIDSDNINRVALKSEKRTNESNGTTIIIPVKKTDFESFKKAIEKSTFHWEVRPTFNGQEINYEDIKYDFSGADWKLVQYNHSNASTSNANAIVDGIQYEIDVSILDKYNNFYFPFNFYFNIGELSLSAGRDSLFYDQKTKNNLIQRIQLMIDEFKTTLESKINSFASLHEASLFKKRYFELLCNLDISELYWKSHNLFSFFKLESINRNLFGKDYAYKHSGRALNIAPHKIFDLFLYKKIYVNDTGRSINTFIGKIYDLEASYKFAVIHVNMKDSNAQEILSKLDNLGFPRLSNLIIFEDKEKSIKIKQQYVSKLDGIFSLRKLVTSDDIGTNRLERFKFNELSPKKVAYFTTSDKKRLFSGKIIIKYYYDLNEIKDFINLDVVVCNEKAVIPKNWVRIEDAIYEKLEEAGLPAQCIDEFIIDYISYQEYHYLNKFFFLRHYLRNHSINNLIVSLKDDSDCKLYILKSIEIENNLDKYKNLIQILKIIFNSKFDTGNVKHSSLQDLYNQLELTYPLINVINYNQYSIDINKFIDYISIMDDVKKQKIIGKNEQSV